MTEWKTVTFADVVSLSTARTADPLSAGIERFVGLEHIEPENLHIRSWGLVADGTTFTNAFKRGQVLFGKRRAYQRKVAVADFDGVCSSDIYVFESKDPKVFLPELLPFICQSEGFYEYAVKTSAGSLSPRTNWSHLANYEFPLPPLDEQRRVADLLWAADNLEASLFDSAVKAEQLKNSYLNSIFFSDDRFSQIYGHFRTPKTWRLLTLPELVIKKPNSLTAGPFGTIFKAKDFRSGGIPILQIRHITKNGFRFDDKLTFMDVDIYERVHKPYTVYPGDLLITKLGDPPGVACIYPSNAPVAMVTPDVIKASLDTCIVLPEYAVHMFNNSRARANITRLCKGGTRTRVSLGEFYKLLWPIPTLDEQKRILSILEPLGLIEPSVEEQKSKLSAIRKEVMRSIGM